MCRFSRVRFTYICTNILEILLCMCLCVYEKTVTDRYESGLKKKKRNQGICKNNIKDKKKERDMITITNRGREMNQIHRKERGRK